MNKKIVFPGFCRFFSQLRYRLLQEMDLAPLVTVLLGIIIAIVIVAIVAFVLWMTFGNSVAPWWKKCLVALLVILGFAAVGYDACSAEPALSATRAAHGTAVLLSIFVECWIDDIRLDSVLSRLATAFRPLAADPADTSGPTVNAA